MAVNTSEVKAKASTQLKITDDNGNEVLVLKDGNDSAVNEVAITNAATGAGPTISSQGGDTNVDLNVTTKGTGAVSIESSYLGLSNGATSAGELRFYEDSDDGAHYFALKAGAMGSSITYTLPTADGSNGQQLTTNGSGVLSWTDQGASGGGSTAADDIGTGDAAVTIATSTGNITIDAQANDSDIIFKGTDGSADTTFLTIDGSDAGTATFNHDVKLGSDAAVLGFGADNEITITHVHNEGLALKHTATGDDKPIVLTLQTGETDIQANDVLGKIAFQAPDEGTGTDAILVAASIQAISEGDFSSSNNATKLSFSTGASAAAAERMSLSSDGNLTVSGKIITDNTTEATSTTDGSLQTDGGLSVAKSAVIGDDLDLLSNGAILNIGNAQKFTLTHSNANNTVMVTADHRLAFGDAADYITGDGTDLKIVSSGDVIVTGDLIPAADDTHDLGTTSAAWQDLHLEGDVLFTDAGKVSTAAGNLTIDAAGSDADIVFTGNDGGSNITALTLDMSAAGAASFNSTVTSTGLVMGSVSINETDLGKIDGITNGTAVANKAVVLDGSKNIATIGTVGCGAITSTGNSSMAQLTTSGRIIVDDATDATSTTDGSLQTDGGLSVAKDAVIGDDLILLSDQAAIHFGADKDVTLTHDPDDGLIIKSTATADNNPTLLTLQTGETDIQADDVIGKIAFQAPDEGTGTDAILVAAAIQARSEGDFAADANATSIDFMLGSSEAATTKVTIESTGNMNFPDGRGIAFGGGSNRPSVAGNKSAGTLAFNLAGAQAMQFSNTNLATFAGRIITDDTTEATSTTDGSLQTDGGLSVAKSAVIGDDLDLLSNGAILNIGNSSKFTLTDQNSNNTVMASANHRLAFGNAAEYITGDGTDLTIASSAKINLTATSDIHVPNNVGIVFGGDSEKIEGDGTDLTISANNLTIDCAADLILDAGGNNTTFKSGGTSILDIINNSSDVEIRSMVQDKDIKFQGNDGGSTITALTLDMSEAGNASFNSNVLIADGKSIVFGDGMDAQIKWDHGGKEALLIDGGIHATSTDNNNNPIIELENASDGGSTCLLIDNDDVDQLCIDIDAENTTADIINIQANALTTGIAIDIPNADALTTGSILNLVSNASSDDNRTLAKIEASHANSDNVIPLQVKNACTHADGNIVAQFNGPVDAIAVKTKQVILNSPSGTNFVESANFFPAGITVLGLTAKVTTVIPNSKHISEIGHVSGGTPDNDSYGTFANASVLGDANTIAKMVPRVFIDHGAQADLRISFNQDPGATSGVIRVTLFYTEQIPG